MHGQKNIKSGVTFSESLTRQNTTDNNRINAYAQGTTRLKSMYL